MSTAFTRFHKTAFVLLLASGCRSDDVVAPAGGPLSLTAGFEQIPGGTVAVPIRDSSVSDAGVPLPYLPRRVLLRATLTGTVDIRRTPYNPADGPLQPGAPRTVGPPGYYYGPPQYGPDIQGCGAQLRVGYAGTGSTQYLIPCASDGSTDTIVSAQGFMYAQGGGSVTRTAAAPGSGCYQPSLGWGPCFYYSTSGQTATIELVTADLSLTASPTTVNYNDTVTVTASINPSQVGGFNVPWTIDSVRWSPDFGTQASPCSWNLFVPNTGDAPSRTCRRPFTRSGTLTVSATVNDRFKQMSVRINVTPPQLDVTASPASIPSAQAVTFTAAVTPSSATWNVSSWTWRPDSGTGGISPSNCAWTEKVCTRTISKSGWMKATATVGEYALVDSARVYLIPCPTGDSLVDRESVRKLLIDRWAQSNPTAPGANRIERGGYVYDSLGTDITVLSALDPSDTPCQNSNPRTRTLPIVTGGHSHPFRPSADSLPWLQCGWPPPPPGGYYIMDMRYGGPSGPDWVRSWVDQRPHVMIDADSIYRYGPPDSLRAVPNPQNPSDTTYVPAGNWQSRIQAYPRNTGSCTRP